MCPIKMHIPKKYEFLIPVLIGTFFYLLVIGWKPLNPVNIAWLSSGDPVVHYLGWEFFRSDSWHFPLGLNPNYGLNISNSIVYSDSIPVLAIIFKIFDKFLPQPFQYFGLWLLLCFLLQAWFAWLLMGLISKNLIIRALGSALITFSPPLMWRMHPQIGHLSLTGHFLILWGIYLTINKSTKNKGLQGIILLSLATLIHAYFLVILFTLWIINLLDELFKPQYSKVKILLSAICTTLIVLILLWVTGYFEVGKSAATGGYGKNVANLLAIFDPTYTLSYGSWSHILPNIPGDELSHEGFNYIGLGFLFLFTAIVFSGRAKNFNYQKIGSFINKPLLATTFVMLIFSFSNNISIGPFQISIPIPDKAALLAGIFRSSGRMFWLPFYVVEIIIIFVLVKRLTKETVIVILSLGLLIQVTDTKNGWIKIRERMTIESSSQWKSPLTSKFWGIAPNHYLNITRIAPMNSPSNWSSLAYFAQVNHMRTNSVALARVDALKLATANADTLKISNLSLPLDSKTIYILDQNLLPEFSEVIGNPENSFFLVDGFYVLAPRCQLIRQCREVVTEFQHH